MASDILAAVGLAAGYDVKKSDVLGLAVRGGAVVSHVRWGDTVHSPIVPEGKVDILLAFELLEGLRWLDQVNPEGAILINRQRIFPVVVSSGVSGYPSDEEAPQRCCGPQTMLTGARPRHRPGAGQHPRPQRRAARAPCRA